MYNVFKFFSVATFGESVRIHGSISEITLQFNERRLLNLTLLLLFIDQSRNQQGYCIMGKDCVNFSTTTTIYIGR